MTKNIRPWCVLASVIGTLALTQAARAVPAGYQLIWNDEFNGTQLDTSKWNYRQLGPRLNGVNTVDAIALDGAGHLDINNTAVPDGTGGYTYTTGMIGTQGLFEHKYGYWEASLDMPQTPSKWSAFWLQSPKMGQYIGDTNAAGTEVDVVEYSSAFGGNSGTTYQSTLHWDGYGSSTKQSAKVLNASDIANGFHTYGVLWTPTSYTFFYDGKATWTTTQAISGIAEYAILSTEIGPWAGTLTPTNFPDTLAVDYVRVYDSIPLSPIPEPACAALLVAGVGLGARRRKQARLSA